MAGRGPAPKAHRRRANEPARGDWQQPAPGAGWQHGPIPPAPPYLLEVSERVWDVWMRSWFAAHWTPDDLPGLELTVQLFDQVKRSIADPFIESESPKGGTIYVRRPSPASEVRQLLDSYGITFKGQQDRRWQRPTEAENEVTNHTPSPYTGLFRKVRSVA